MEIALLRSRYRDLARELHPDRLAGAAAEDRMIAERRMAELNEAWHHLGDARRRAVYDAHLVGSRASSDGSPSPADAAGDRWESGSPLAPARSGGTAWLVALGLAFLLGMVVVTAYAGSVGEPAGGSAEAPTAESVQAVTDLRGGCVRLVDGFTLVQDCSIEPNEGAIVAQAALGAECPAGTEAFIVPQHRVLACVERGG